MKKIIFALVFVALPFSFVNGATDFFLEIDGVKGETTTSAPTQTTRVAPDTDTKASVDYYIKIPDIEGESSQTTGIEPDEIDVSVSGAAKKKGNVEYGWKVEEGESLESSGVEPDEIDYSDDGEPITPDFGILLGRGSEDQEEAEANRTAVAQILFEGMQEAGAPVESVSLNFEKVTTKVTQPVKILGIIPVFVSASVEIDAQNQVKVRFPWWAILSTGKDEALGERVFTTLSNILKAKEIIVEVNAETTTDASIETSTDDVR